HHDASVFLIVKSRQQCFAVPVDGAFAHDIGKGICKPREPIVCLSPEVCFLVGGNVQNTGLTSAVKSLQMPVARLVQPDALLEHPNSVIVDYRSLAATAARDKFGFRAARCYL